MNHATPLLSSKTIASCNKRRDSGSLSYAMMRPRTHQHVSLVRALVVIAKYMILCNLCVEQLTCQSRSSRLCSLPLLPQRCNPFLVVSAAILHYADFVSSCHQLLMYYVYSKNAALSNVRRYAFTVYWADVFCRSFAYSSYQFLSQNSIILLHYKNSEIFTLATAAMWWRDIERYKCIPPSKKKEVGKATGFTLFFSSCDFNVCCAIQ